MNYPTTKDFAGRTVPKFIEADTVRRAVIIGNRIEIETQDEDGNLEFSVAFDRGELLDALLDDTYIRRLLTSMSQTGERARDSDG